MNIETNNKCPQCSDDLIFPRGETPYCENCGWPDENRPEITIEEMSDVELREALVAAKEQLAKAITALEPFAAINKQVNSTFKDAEELYIHHRFGYSSVYVNMGDVRLASTTLAELKGE